MADEERRLTFIPGSIIAANEDVSPVLGGAPLIYKDYLYQAGHSDLRGIWILDDTGVNRIYDPNKFRRAKAVALKES